MDGIASSTSSSVVVIAACNTPWDLDDALRRRLEKRIHVPLPDRDARHAMFAMYLTGVECAPGLDFSGFAAATDGYSGADIKVVCREASMAPLRRLLATRTTSTRGMQRDMQRDMQDLRAAAASTSNAPLSMVTATDVDAAIASTKPSVAREDAERYVAWERKFGAA